MGRLPAREVGKVEAKSGICRVGPTSDPAHGIRRISKEWFRHGIVAFFPTEGELWTIQSLLPSFERFHILPCLPLFCEFYRIYTLLAEDQSADCSILPEQYCLTNDSRSRKVRHNRDQVRVQRPGEQTDVDDSRNPGDVKAISFTQLSALSMMIRGRCIHCPWPASNDKDLEMGSYKISCEVPSDSLRFHLTNSSALPLSHDLYTTNNV